MNAKGWTLVATVLASGIVFLDLTVVNVALPRIGREVPSTLFGVLEGQSYAALLATGAAANAIGIRNPVSPGETPPA